MTRKRRRLWIVLACGIGLGSAAALVLTAFSDSIVFFVSPTDLAKTDRIGRTVRLGGLVEQNSVTRGTAGDTATTFKITDGVTDVTVTYNGILPDLFREGQGVVTLGKLRPNGVFVASEVLAKHDENYMPKEVAEALKKSGHWNPSSGAPPPPASTWNTEGDTGSTKGAGG
jgi:cytochrome c-type biogenesis protein CcmE